MTFAKLVAWRRHLLLGALCAGIGAANGARISPLVALAFGIALAGGASVSTEGRGRLVLVAGTLFALGLGWGGARLDALDRSVLLGEVDRAERAVVVVTGPPRRGRFDLRAPVEVRRFGARALREPALLQLPQGRAPPQGAILEVLCEVVLPRGPKDGFDERTWLRRHGMHVVLKGDRWRVVGRRGGIAGLGDRLRDRLARSVAVGLDGQRRAVLLGVVLGADEGIDDGLRQRFRASGLYHLLAVSGQNVVLVAGGALFLAWLLGLPRWLGEIGALGAIGSYVLVVGSQPSVIRAGVAGALVSLAWLTARASDRWYFLLLGALVLLVWSPYVLLDAGFQLSFAAVAAIFTLVPRVTTVLEGYPVPRPLAMVVAVSASCAAVTAPILWLQFHAVPLLTVPANAAAAPVVAPLLYLACATAGLSAVAPAAAGIVAQLNGWCAAYLAGCARLVGGLPFAQLRSGRVVAVLTLLAVGTAAYAWRRWRTSSLRT
ncbi:MAG: competence protein ComEC family protein [Actinomycetota bacterium]|nr:competence protein ComEC family protein [Actinomycetota bacterium]